MNARSLLLKLHRRLRGLLPAEVQTIAVLAPQDAGCWGTSPFSCLPLTGGRQGGVALRLAAGWAAEVCRRGLSGAAGWLGADAPRYLTWQALTLPGTVWCRSEDGRLALLVDAGDGVAWLFWQELLGRRSTW